MIKGCIFDLDGTLINSLDDLAISTNYLLEKYNYSTHDVSKYNLFVGNGIYKLLERAFGEHCTLDINQLKDEFNEYYHIHCNDKTKPYIGIESLLDELSLMGIQLAVVTNKPHDVAMKIVKHYFGERFVCIYGGSDLYPIKPCASSTYLACQDMHIEPNECIFIGDSDVDIYTGKNASMKTIGVSWGFRGRDELKKAGADYIVDVPSQIKEIVCENRN